jgi:hypothetical protein
MMMPEELAREQSPVENHLVIDRSPRPTPMISATTISTADQASVVPSNEQFRFASLATADTGDQNENSHDLVEPSSQITQTPNASSNDADRWPYLALITVIVLAIVGAIATDKRN